MQTSLSVLEPADFFQVSKSNILCRVADWQHADHSILEEKIRLPKTTVSLCEGGKNDR